MLGTCIVKLKKVLTSIDAQKEKQYPQVNRLASTKYFRIKKLRGLENITDFIPNSVIFSVSIVLMSKNIIIDII